MGIGKSAASSLFCAAALLAQFDPAALDKLAESERARTRAPGLALAAVLDGKMVYTKAFGVASVETKEPLTAAHLFRVGSTTKMMVAAAALRLAGEGALKLDAPIGDYLPELDPGLRSLTARQLLSHTAGLEDLTLMYGAHDDEALAANVRTLRAAQLFTKPGAVFSYSNLGYVLAGRLVEVLSRKPFADAMKDLVFEPLGMKRTTFRPTLAMTYPFSQGHQGAAGAAMVVRPVGDHVGYWPAGSMFTSAEEFARMALALLGGGQVDGRQALPAEVAGTLLTPAFDTISAVPNSKYGFGLFFEEAAGERLVHHGGARIGYSSQMFLVPARKAGVVVIANLSGGDTSTLARRALGAITGLNLQDRPKAPEMKIDPGRLAGIYSQGSRFVVIAPEDGQAVLTVEGKKIPLKPAPGPCFSGTGLGTVCFAFDAEGRANYLAASGRVLARR